MRVIFVDDEPRIIRALERLMFPYADEWDMEFVTDARDALDAMNQGFFDVIVTDMRMPRMDGATLLKEVRERHPDTARIILSGYSNAQAAVHALPYAHQYLSKPCDAETLTRVLERAVGLNELVCDPALRSIVGDLTALPVQPVVYQELSRELSSGDVSLRRVAEIVEQDMTIAANMLHMANTAFFAARRPITSVEGAVMRLGVELVRGLVLSTEVCRCFQPRARRGCPSLDVLQRHSLEVADIVAQLLRADRTAREAAQLAALLHDVGILVLAAHLPDYLERACLLGVE